jgi:hypothetical protein
MLQNPQKMWPGLVIAGEWRDLVQPIRVAIA